MDSYVNRKFTVSAPGRVCLYGEHQDYLGMPSVVMAVNLRCSIQIEEREDRIVVWSSPKLVILLIIVSYMLLPGYNYTMND